MGSIKSKLISIALGAIGSAITVLLSHFAASPVEVQAAAAFGGGAIANGMFGDVASKLFGVA